MRSRLTYWRDRISPPVYSNPAREAQIDAVFGPLVDELEARKPEPVATAKHESEHARARRAEKVLAFVEQLDRAFAEDGIDARSTLALLRVEGMKPGDWALVAGLATMAARMKNQGAKSFGPPSEETQRQVVEVYRGRVSP